jgi:hypothetical protein
LLEVGKGIEDPAFGMSYFFAPAGAIGSTPTGEDFITFNPPPPVNVAGKWFHFSTLSTGVDSIGSFLNLLVTEINPLNGIVGDLNQDTFVNTLDINLFIAGWLADTSSMSSIDKYLRGDINLNGLTDLSDAVLMNRALKANGVGSGLPFGLLGAPEPSAITLLAIAVAMLLIRRRP